MSRIKNQVVFFRWGGIQSYIIWPWWLQSVYLFIQFNSFCRTRGYPLKWSLATYSYLSSILENSKTSLWEFLHSLYSLRIPSRCILDTLIIASITFYFSVSLCVAIQIISSNYFYFINSFHLYPSCWIIHTLIFSVLLIICFLKLYWGVIDL